MSKENWFFFKRFSTLVARAVFSFEKMALRSLSGRGRRVFQNGSWIHEKGAALDLETEKALPATLFLVSPIYGFADGVMS